MLQFLNNDTIALLALGLVAVCGVFCGQENLSAAAIGAMGGYIGSRLSDTA